MNKIVKMSFSIYRYLGSSFDCCLDKPQGMG